MWVQSPLGLFLASPPLTCPPFLSLCPSSLSLNPESWTGEREGAWGRVTDDSVCGEGQGGRGCEPDQRAARACPWSHTGGHNVELLPSPSAPLALPGTSQACIRAIEWGAERGPAGLGWRRPAQPYGSTHSSRLGWGPTRLQICCLLLRRRRKGPSPLRSFANPAPHLRR